MLSPPQNPCLFTYGNEPISCVHISPTLAIVSDVFSTLAHLEVSESIKQIYNVRRPAPAEPRRLVRDKFPGQQGGRRSTLNDEPPPPSRLPGPSTPPMAQGRVGHRPSASCSSTWGGVRGSRATRRPYAAHRRHSRHR
jgi:hypothetical protein